MDSEKKEGKEFDWISNVSKDYWDHYDAVVFNKKLSKNEFTEFINQALKSTQPANASDWNDDDEMSDLEYLNYRIRREGQAFIGKYVDEKGRTVLVYGKDPHELYPEVKNPITINYEDIKKGLNESGDGDEDFGVESEEDYIEKEYGWLTGGTKFDTMASGITNKDVFKAKYILTNEIKKGNSLVYLRNNFLEFLNKVNAILGTDIKITEDTFLRMTTRYLENTKDVYGLSDEQIQKWVDAKQENIKGGQFSAYGREKIDKRFDELKKYLNKTNVWEIDYTKNELLDEFGLLKVKNFEFNEIIDAFKGNPTKEFYLKFISKIVDDEKTRAYWGTFVKYSKGINEIITNNKIPDEQTKLGKGSTQKYMKSLKFYFEKIKNEEYCYIFSDNCELTSSEIEKVMDFFGETYENSFLTKGFKKDDTRGTESRIHNLGDVGFSFSEEIKSADFDVDEISKYIIKNIEDYLKNNKSIVKYDLITSRPIKDINNKTIIPNGGKVEVKDINYVDSYLSEFLASPVKKTEYGIRNNPKYLKRYNEVIGRVYTHLDENYGEIIISKIKDGLEGIIISNNIYVPNKPDNIKFYLSDIGRSNPKEQLRITVRYEINESNWENFYVIDDNGVLQPLDKDTKKVLKSKNKQISESDDLDWIKDAYKTEWTFDDIAQLYYAGDVESVKVVGFKDLKHLNGALDWCAGSGDFKNNFKVGSVHQILSTNLDIDGETSHNEFTVSDLDCGWCLDDPDSIGYDCNERPKTMSLRFKPKDPDFFVFSEDWVKLEPIFISDDLNESSEDFDWAKDITAEFHKGMCLRRKDGTQWLVVDTPKYAQKGTTLVWLQRTHTNGVSITEKRRPVSPHRISTLNRLIQSGKLVICDEPLKESGDFDWVGDVPNTLPKDETWVLVNDVDPESEKVSVEIQNFLFQNQGFKWISGKDTAYHRPFLALSYHSEPKYSDSGIGYHDLSGYFDSEGNPNFEKRLKQFREDFGKGIYFWSDLKNNIINESKDDFDWVEDVVPNLFHGRDIKFYIDEIPTQEQSEYIWDMLVDAGVTDRDRVIRYNRVNKLMNSVGTFIFVDYDGDFLHNVQDLGGYIENGRISAGNIIKFSDIFPNDEPSDSNDLNTFIKESGDFDWVEDVPITLNNIFYKLEVGDELTLKGNTHGIHTSGDVTKFKYTEPFKITIQSTGPKLEDSTFKISVKEKEAIVNLGIKHKGELLKKYPNFHVFKDNSFFKEDGDLEVVSWVKSEDRIDESKNDFDWIEDVSGSLPKNNNWMLINDVDPKSLEVSKDIQDYLFSKGLKWNTGRGTPLYQPILAIHYVLPKLQKNGSFTYVPNSIPFEKSRLEVEYDREEYIKKGKQVYYWSQLKPKKEDVKESEDLQWIKDTELIDPKKPKPGYVYHWDGYSNFFGGENIKSDHIVIKKSEIDEGNMYYFFDTLDFFWGDEPDAVMKTEFNRRLNDGTMTFSYKLSQ